MIGPLLKGLSVTFGHLFKPAVTVKYPYEKREVADRYRGKHLLWVDEKGRERCCACGLCEAVCPADAIRLYGKEDTEYKLSDVGKVAEVYVIDYGRCIFCGYCVDACPRGAIEMTQDYELTEAARKVGPPRQGLVYDKERLMVKMGEAQESEGGAE
jgi:NADH-quinone oxidoreductase subunit I